MLEFGLRGIVARAMTAFSLQPDGGQSNAAGMRIGRYGEQYALSLFPGMESVADEGTYFAVNGAQSGIAGGATTTAFSATTPYIIIYNKDSQPNGKRIYMDYILLIATAVNTAGTSVQCAVTLDAGNRYTSGGTDLTTSIVNPNFDAGSTSIARFIAGAITSAAASTSVRNIVGTRLLKGAILAANDTFLLKFGGVDSPVITASNGTVFSMMQPFPQVIIGPNECMVFDTWAPSQTGAQNYLVEAGWVER